METPATSGSKICFGVFEADLASGELRRRGRKVALQDQPFQLLALLLRHPGDVVTREDLQHALWPADTFVEFEHGVNTAIKKVRQALGDSADNPRFIETLPRKGYRFIAPVALPETPVRVTVVRQRRWVPVAAGLAVVAAGLAIWLLNKNGKPAEPVPVPIPLTSFPGYATTPSFSPDGERLAFAWNGPKRGDLDVYVKLIGEDQPHRLTTDPAADRFPAWSPDGKWIAVSRDDGKGNAEVLLIPSVGGAEHKVADLFTAGIISYNPSGRWLVVSGQNAALEPIHLIAVSIETGEKRTLTSPPPGMLGDFDPAVSPDGRTVVFARSPAEEVADLYLMRLSEDLRPMGEPTRVTFFEGCAGEPAWWPDGRSILFSSGAVCHSLALWRMRVSANRRVGEPERLPFGGESRFHAPTISRQGRIAYVERRLTASLWRLDLGGGREAEILPASSSRIDHLPQYSPDGSRIAFSSNRSGNFEIWVSKADGSNTVKLTSFDGPYVASPTWSPDGKRIAFDARPHGIGSIYLIGADGGKPERVAGTELNRNGVTSWSRDGKWIYISSDRTGKNQVWKIPAEGGEPTQVTRQGGTYAVESPDGKFVYYVRSFGENEVTEIWRVLSDGGEEVRIVDSAAGLCFTVGERGIYYFSSWHDPSIQFYNFATKKVETAGRVKGNIGYGFTVSPDGRQLVYALYGDSSANVMLVDNYR